MMVRCISICVCLIMFSVVIQGQISLESYATGFTNPVDIAQAGDQSNRLFVVEQRGTIRIIDSEANIYSQNFLDIRSKVGNSTGERGLLGLAFHPNFEENGFFFVYYTSSAGNSLSSIVERYKISSNDFNIADPTSGEVVFSFDQPFSNHNGGDLNFGPDGYLYIASGDGGSGNDPNQNGQDVTSPLGKILRIDVSQLPFSIPADNPFANTSGDTLPYIWALGLRNP